MEELQGYVERITFQNKENGFTVAKLKTPQHLDLLCIVGILPALQVGQTIHAKGKWNINQQHGKQFEIHTYHVEAPSDLLGIQKYLASGLIKGIGPVYAKKIVQAFGLNTLNVIDENPNRLREIPGIGSNRIETISNCWREQRSIREIMIFLQSHDISPAYAHKIFKTYGEKSVKKVQENPYNLSKDIFGIGFKIADTIAKKMGIDQESIQRIDAGIEYVLSQLANDGHACYPAKEFSSIAQTILDVSPSLIHPRLESLELHDRIVNASVIYEGEETTFIWLKPLYACERGIGREVQRLILAPASIHKINTGKALIWVQKQLKIQLAPLQEKAVSQALKKKLLIITGGPGTGKSTITKAILTLTEFLSKQILLAAPTGRAAKRMSEITGREAKTIHSLLEYDFKTHGFKRNRENPLKCELIIVDEASMIDTYLMYNLLKALPNETRVVFVGDINQLPSVGPGNVLKDMIQSMRISTIHLKEIFRQEKGSLITANAHKINSGIFPDICNRHSDDFFFVKKEEKEEVLDTIIHLVCSRLPKKYGFNPFEDIQLLAPMKRGLIGTENLNDTLQKLLNPKDLGINRLGIRFSCGDKVMQIRNNYRKEVYNGDIGRIIDIDTIEQKILVRIENREIPYNFRELDELRLAYAISVHKFQGSECPCIVMPVHTSHFKLLHRNLLYTGVTRGKKLVVLVGSKKALAIAIQNDDVKKRYTTLQQSLLAMTI